MMDAIVSAWVIAIGGPGIIGGLCAMIFIFMIGAVFFKMTT